LQDEQQQSYLKAFGRASGRAVGVATINLRYIAQPARLIFRQKEDQRRGFALPEVNMGSKNDRMIMRRIRNSLIAGLCGAAVHSLLVLVHGKTGPLPEFQPNADIERGLSWLVGGAIQPVIAWLLSFVSGALIWGFLLGQSYRFLPGKGPWQKGAFFGVFAWIVMGLVFFPLMDRGIFAIKLGLGMAPAILMLVMFLAYSVTMSLVYHTLSGNSV
jgi:hypothetical protein